MSEAVMNKLHFSNIDTHVKLEAIKDIYMMQMYTAYGKHVAYNFTAVNLFECFIFSKSILGSKFWFDLSKIIDND
jgi:hypothetical protein